MLFSIPARVMSMQITLQSTDNESIQLIVFYLQKLPDETKEKKISKYRLKNYLIIRIVY